MFKKIALLLLFVVPMGVVAQTLKFGHINLTEVITTMPEYAKAQTDMQALEKKYVDEIKRTSDELNKKYTEFMTVKDSLPLNISERRQKELQEMVERGQQYEQEVQQILTKAQNDMTTPIFKKADDAVKAVGAEQGFIYIFDISRTAIPYVNDKVSLDTTPLVKTKLGIK